MMITELNVSDGQITEFSIQSDVVTVVLKDWQEKIHKIIFKNVIGIEAYSPENVDLCHITVILDSERLRKICSIVEEDENEITEYSFISAWNDLPILTIFGEVLEIK